MERVVRMLYWLMYWAYKTIWLASVGFALAFVSANAGQLAPALGIAALTLAGIVLIVVQRGRELARVRARRKAGPPLARQRSSAPTYLS